MLKFRLFIQDALKSVSLSGRAQPSFSHIDISKSISTRYLSLLLIAVLLALCTVTVPAANAKTVTLGWDANKEPDLEGYVLYRNTGSPGPPYNYSDEVPEEQFIDPLHPQAKLTGLQEGKQYYIALTAYNGDGVESSFSNDICVEVVNGNIELCGQNAAPSTTTSSSSGGGGGSDGGGGGGFGCFISGAGSDATVFSKWAARPDLKSQVLIMLFLLLVLMVAVKPGFSRSYKENH